MPMPDTSGVQGTVTPGGRHIVTMVRFRVGCARLRGSVWAGQAPCADAVRGCPCGRAARSPRARTYSGQRRRSGHHFVVFAQVRDRAVVQAVAVCKTVGSAYVGSNPTPATTSETAPWLRIRARQAVFFSSRRVSSCVTVESMRCGVHGRLADGGHAIRTVGAHRWLFRGRP